jgi:hypothetical protein
LHFSFVFSPPFFPLDLASERFWVFGPLSSFFSCLVYTPLARSPAVSLFSPEPLIGWVLGGYLLHLQAGQIQAGFVFRFGFSFVAFFYTKRNTQQCNLRLGKKSGKRKTISLWLLPPFFLLGFRHFLPVSPPSGLHGIQELFFQEIPPWRIGFLVQDPDATCTRLEHFSSSFSPSTWAFGFSSHFLSYG